MTKAARLALSIFIIFGVLVIGLMAASKLLVPNFIKMKISEEIYQLTGHSLVINGDVQWTFFPWLGVKVQNVVINNNGGFGQTPLAKADSVQLNVKLLPLFERRFEVGTVVVKDFNIYLIKNPNGQTNWAHLLTPPRGLQKSIDKTEDHAEFTMSQIEAMNFEQGKIFWVDRQKNKHVEFSELNFSAKHISLHKAFPYKLSFNFKRNCHFSGNASVSGVLNIDGAKNIFSFSGLTLDGSLNDLKGKKSFFHMVSDLVYMAKNSQFFLKKLTAKLNDYKFGGDLSGVISPTFVARGHLQSEALFIDGFLFKDVRTEINIKDAIISLHSLVASLYGGSYTGDILIDTHSTTNPMVTLNGMLTKADAAVLATHVMHKNNTPFTGTIDMSTMLKFNLGHGDQMLQTLNGSIIVRLQNGVLHGINIPALIEIGQAIFKRTALPTVQDNQTDFGVIKGTFQIKNGVMFNRDLTLQSSQLMASGYGVINLVDEQIDYHLKAGLIGHEKQIPILIQGGFNRPIIAPDVAQVAKEAVADQLGGVIAKAVGQEDTTERRKLQKAFSDELKNLATQVGI